MKKLMLISVFTALCFAAAAQPTIGEVLDIVERNNASLKAARGLRDALTLEAKTGNSLENPQAEFVYGWGNPLPAGTKGELDLIQGFDFPTSYVHRREMAKLRERQYGYEYAASRQGILLEAQSLCIEIIALRKKREILRTISENARYAVGIMDARARIGDANALETDRAKYEYVSANNAYNLNEIELSSALGRLAALNGGMPLDFTAGDFPYTDTRIPSFEYMAERYENISPEMHGAVAGLHAAERGVKLSRSQSLPRLAAGYRHEFASDGKFNGVIVGMSIPMFGNRNNVKRARAQSVYAEALLNETKTDIMSNLSELYSRVGLLGSAISEYSGIAEHMQSVSLSRQALEAGHIPIADYFSQLRPIYDVRLTLIDTMLDYNLTLAEIMMIDL